MGNKKSRPDPMSEGSMARISKLFLEPILFNHCPPDADKSAFLADIFDVDHRHITHWKSKKPFRIKGLFFTAANVKVQGIGYRDVPVGTVLTVRHNTRRPTSIELEFMGGVGRAEQVFSLTDSEWNEALLSLEPYDYASKPRHRNRVQRKRVPKQSL